MFRELARKNKAISQEECISILKNEKRGVLSVNGDNGYPYGMPMNHYYNEKDGMIYFHGGKAGHKIDALKKDAKVSFCVYDQGYHVEEDWALRVKSVIVFGRVEFVENMDETIEISRQLSYKFTDDDAYIDREIKRSGPGTLVFRIVPEYMTGKLVTES